MKAFVVLWDIIKGNILKIVILFVLSGTAGVLGIVPGTENVSNVLGSQITNIKAGLGTTASPTLVQ